LDIKPSSGLIEMIENAPRALTAQELAEFLHVSDMTIYQFAKAGSIPSFRVGNSLRFDPKALANWLREQTYSPVRVSQAARLPQKPHSPW
jgi:excisionase family DNA binding protein